MRKRALPASYPDVSLLMKMCAQRKAGRRQRALPMLPCGSSPVTRFALASAMRENEAPEEEAGALLYPPDKSLREREIYPIDSFIYLLNN